MEGTKFELRHWDNPDHMYRTMILNNVLIVWHSEGDPVNDPDHYTESFDLTDFFDPSNNAQGLTRAEVDQLTWNIYWEEQCR
jgi:hypothetical protein